MRHPLANETCPVLQYADDTLILVRAEVQDVVNLKMILDNFAAATGLQINYHKSTAVPMHVDDDLLPQLLQILQCQQATFPQVYLGLPLSNTKLNLQAFAPLIAKVDRRLSGWQSNLLNKAGQAVLINSVLDGMVTHIMAAVALPPGILDQLESKRRAFLWSGKSKTKGVCCLVAWDVAPKPRTEGSLGVKNLATVNSYLLLKLLHRLHHPGDSSWAAWARQRVDLASMTGLDGTHWDSISSILPAYRCITNVSIGDGRSTSFWEDKWITDLPLSAKFPTLHSHSTNNSVTVCAVIQQGLRSFLVPRLTSAAATECRQLEDMIFSVSLTADEDTRSSMFERKMGFLNSSLLYRTSTSSGQKTPGYRFVWRSHAPPKVKFFGWLLLHNRLQCRVNLHRKGIVEEDICPICQGAPETEEHMFRDCPFAVDFWTKLGVEAASTPDSAQIWEFNKPATLPYQLFPTLVLLCY